MVLYYHLLKKRFKAISIVSLITPGIRILINTPVAVVASDTKRLVRYQWNGEGVNHFFVPAFLLFTMVLYWEGCQVMASMYQESTYNGIQKQRHHSNGTDD